MSGNQREATLTAEAAKTNALRRGELNSTKRGRIIGGRMFRGIGKVLNLPFWARSDRGQGVVIVTHGSGRVRIDQDGSASFQGVGAGDGAGHKLP